MSLMLKLLAITLLLSSFAQADSSKAVKDFLQKNFAHNPGIKSIDIKVTNSISVNELAIREVFNSIGPVELSKSVIDIEYIETLLKARLPVNAVELRLEGLGKLTRLVEGNRFVIPKRITSDNIIAYDYNVSIVYT